MAAVSARASPLVIFIVKPFEGATSRPVAQAGCAGNALKVVGAQDVVCGQVGIESGARRRGPQAPVGAWGEAPVTCSRSRRAAWVPATW